MNSSIISSLVQEPAAICECLVAVLTACYLFKLTFLSISQQKRWIKSQLQSAYDTGCCINTWNTGLRETSQSFKNDFLKLFALGEQIHSS